VQIVVALESHEEGFTVSVPTLPGCIASGKTKEEAIQRIREAMNLYLEPDEDDLKDYPKDAIFEKIEA
jgi:predicted RNase H-like HicB family nuclease